MTTEQPKSRKRPFMRWVWRLLGSVLILLLALIIIVPVVFKDEIVESARKAVERNIHGELTFQEAQVGLLKAFPNFCLKLSDVTLTGQTSDTLLDPLLRAEAIEIVLDLRSVISKNRPVEVVGLSFDRPEAYLHVGVDGVANYDIMRDTEAAGESDDTPFALEIRKYEIRNGTIKYVDQMAGVSLRLRQLFHDGKIHFEDQDIDVEGTISSGQIAIASGGVTYLRDAEINGDIPLHIDLDSSLYRINDAALNINALKLAVNGDIQISPDMLFDLRFASSRGDFKDFLSLLPNAYTADFDKVKATGNLMLNGQLSGIYDATQGAYPEYRVHLVIEDAAFQYPGKELAFKDIQVNGAIANQRTAWAPEYLDLERFHFELNGAPLDGTLRARELSGAQKVTGSVTGNLSLADFMAAYPVEGYESLSGQADINVEFNIDANAPADKQVVSGHLTIDEFLMLQDGRQVSARRVNSDFSTQAVTLKTEDATVDFHPVAVDLQAVNLLPWYLHDDTLRLSGSLQAQKLVYVESATGDTAGLESSARGMALDKLTLDLRVKCDSLAYDEYIFTSLTADLSGPVDRLRIPALSGDTRGSHVTGSGHLQNLSGYTFHSETLHGQFDLRGDQLDLDAWMVDSEVEESGETATDSMTYVIMPSGLDIAVRYSVGLLTYDKMRLRNVSGTLTVGDRNVQIEEFNADGLGGKMSLAGIYSTPPGEKPDFNLKYDLSNLNFVQTIEQTELFEMLAPIAKFIEGEFSSTLVMQGKLGKDYMPDLRSLTASGYLETIHGQLEKAQVLQKVSNFLNIDPPLNWDLGYTRNWFEIQDGAVELKEFTKQFDDIAVTMAGKHEIQGPMNYNMQFTIPAERLSSNPAGALAQQGLEALQKRLGTLGRSLQTIEAVTVEVNVSGKLNDPVLKITNVKVNQQSAGSMVDQVVSEAKEQLVDTARKVIQTKVQEAKDSASTVIRNAVDSLKTTISERAKEQLNARLDSAQAAAIDSAKASAIEILGEKSGGEIDRIKDSLDNWNPFKKKKKE